MPVGADSALGLQDPDGSLYVLPRESVGLDSQYITSLKSKNHLPRLVATRRVASARRCSPSLTEAEGSALRPSLLPQATEASTVHSHALRAWPMRRGTSGPSADESGGHFRLMVLCCCSRLFKSRMETVCCTTTKSNWIPASQRQAGDSRHAHSCDFHPQSGRGRWNPERSTPYAARLHACFAIGYRPASFSRKFLEPLGETTSSSNNYILTHCSMVL